MRRYEYRECVSLTAQLGFWEAECWVRHCLGKLRVRQMEKKNEGKHKNGLIWLIMLAPLTFTFAWQLDCSGFNYRLNQQQRTRLVHLNVTDDFPDHLASFASPWHLWALSQMAV